MNLLFIRHGQSELGAQKLAAGWIDTALTDIGKTQAREVAEILRDKNVDAIFSSDLKRAHQTATIVREELSNDKEIPLFVDWRLREKYFGAKENQLLDELDWAKLDGDDEEYHRLNNMESPHDLRVRFYSFLNNLLLFQTKYKNVLVVTSGGILVELAKLLNPDSRDFDFDNAQILEYNLSELLDKINGKKEEK
jgi:probable phosphoglycerate mutase